MPTGSPVLVVANHQSVLDICQVTLMARPHVPAFVARAAATPASCPSSPSASAFSAAPSSTRSATPRGAIDAVRRGARELPHGILIFPEGHRSLDGAIRPSAPRGLETILGARRTPVYLVLNEGVWRVRRFADLLFRVHLIDARSEMMGPFEPPADDARLPEFIQGLRQTLVTAWRRSGPGSAPPLA